MRTGTGSRPPVRVRLGLVAGAAALVLGGCTSAAAPADPEEALVQTVQQTLDGSFAYRLVAEADREALEALGRSLGTVAARLNLFEVSGVVAEDTVSVDVQAFGTEPLLQVRRFADDAVYVRVAAGDGPLGALATPELEGRLLGMAIQTDQPDSVVGAIGALFDGAWIGVTGAFDPTTLTGLSDAPSTPATPTRSDTDGATGTPLPEILADYLAVTDQADEDGTTTTRVDLRARALLRSLGSLGTGEVDAAGLEEGLALVPETVTGDVVTRDGVVEAIVFDVAAGARAAGEEVPGALELRLELSDHGAPDPPTVPEATVTVPSAELTAGLAQLLTTPPPPAPESTSPAAP